MGFRKNRDNSKGQEVDNNQTYLNAMDSDLLDNIFDKAFKGADDEREANIRKSYAKLENMMKSGEIPESPIYSQAVFCPTVQSFSAPAQSGNQCLVGVSSIIGRRPNQQDAVAVTETVYNQFSDQKFMAVLSDGMGGMNGGEMASSTCIKQFVSSFNQTISDIPGFLRDQIDYSDERVYSLRDENGDLLGGGATVVCVVIDNGGMYLASVGDSHIYIIRNGNISLLTNEHIYLNTLLEEAKKGIITEDEAYSDPNKEALTSYIGLGGLDLMDVYDSPLRLQKDDVIILCSDGLYRALSDEEIKNIVLSNFYGMDSAASALTNSAMAKNMKHQDNTSVILIKYI